MTKNLAELHNQIELKSSEKELLENWREEQKEELLQLESERQEQEVLRGEISHLESQLSEKIKESQAQVDEVGNLENQRHLLVKNLEDLENKINDITKELKNSNLYLSDANRFNEITSEMLELKKVLSIKEERWLFLLEMKEKNE